MVTDGPFAETKQLIAGFWIWKCQSMQEAIDWVKRCPAAANEAIEIRQVMEFADFPADVQKVASKLPEMQGHGARASTPSNHGSHRVTKGEEPCDS